MALFELVPNISEGRNHETIDRAVEAIGTTGARVLHRTSDPVHNRSVLTIVGDASAVLEAAVALAGAVLETIDLRRHSGVHPRIGALDVVPFVPLRDATMAQAVELAHAAGQRIWHDYRIPCIYYGEAARSAEHTLLADVRSGPLIPDVGEGRGHETAGIVAIGARALLVAFNVELATADVRIARDIARTLRERDGGMRTLRALGFRLDEHRVQVSLNVTDHAATPLHRIVEIIRTLAAARGVAVVGSELIGCIPQAAVETAARYYLGIP